MVEHGGIVCKPWCASKALWSWSRGTDHRQALFRFNAKFVTGVVGQQRARLLGGTRLQRQDKPRNKSSLVVQKQKRQV